MIRIALSASLLFLAACKTGVAPADGDYQVDVGQERSTALGERSTLTGSSGTWNFAAGAALVTGGIVVTEQSSDTTCEARIRHFSDDGDGRYGDRGATECSVISANFGRTLNSADGVMVSGLDSFDSWSSELTWTGGLIPEDNAEGDNFGHAVLTLNGLGFAVGAPGHGVSGAVYIFDYDPPADDADQTQYSQVARISHPGVMENGGFGTTLIGAGPILAIGDGFGRQFVFELSDSGNWLAIDAPGEILAVDGDTALVRPATGSDLRFYDRVDGAWEATGILFGADLPYTQFAFDDVAAFAVQPGAGNFRGFVDRYTRIDGELDASLRLTLDHTGLGLDLQGDRLLVSEALTLGTSGTGQVHVFDWSEDRNRMRMDMFCPNGDDAAEPNDGADQAGESMEGEFVVTTDSPDFFALAALAPGDAVTVDLSVLTGDVDLYLETADGVVLDSSLSVGEAEQVVYRNDGEESLQLYARAKLFGSTNVCGSYAIEASVETLPDVDCGSSDNDTYETAEVFTNAEVVMDSVSAVDFVQFFDLAAQEQITATLDFDEALDFDMCLVGLDGVSITCAAGFSNPETFQFHNQAEAVLDSRIRVRWYSPPTEPTCAPYTLTLGFETIVEEAPPQP